MGKAEVEEKGKDSQAKGKDQDEGKDTGTGADKKGEKTKKTTIPSDKPCPDRKPNVRRIHVVNSDQIIRTLGVREAAASSFVFSF